MEEHISPLAITHLLQHTLRSLCIHDNSHWVYAVFWRILPRNYPPPKWEGQGVYDRSRGNRRNWILVWEDGFCNFGASSTAEINHHQGIQPEIFFKMSHEIYNYGEGLIGKVAADQSHKWIYKEEKEDHENNDQDQINYLSAWHNSADSHPRTWEAQFQSGIKTIALIAVREGVVQLGATHKVVEDLSHVVLLRKNFSYVESIPGVLLPHPLSSFSSSSSSFPFKIDGYGLTPDHHHLWNLQSTQINNGLSSYTDIHPYQFYDHFNQQLRIIPSMGSLEALLSKLPSVVPLNAQPPPSDHQFVSVSMEKVTAPKEQIDDDDDNDDPDDQVYRPPQVIKGAGESSRSSMSGYCHQQHVISQQEHDQNVSRSQSNNMGFN